MNITMETTVASVTVFPDRARVRADGQIELDIGNYQLLVDELPLALEPASVRAGGRGSARVRILSVDVKKMHYEMTPVEEVAKLEAEIESLNDEKLAFSDDTAVLKAQSEYLDGLRQAAEQFARGLALGRSKVEDQLQLTQFMKEFDKSLRQEIRELGKQDRQVQKRVDKLQRDLDQLRSARPKERYRVMVDVEVSEAGSFYLDIAYVVGRAGWQPLYDLRLVESDESQYLELTAIAQISQHTGQDWEDVELLVSTARPALNRQLPELKPWYLDEYKPPVVQPRSAQLRMAPATAMADSEAADMVVASGVKAQEFRAEEAMATAKEADAIVSYVVSDKSDLSGDGTPHKSTLTKIGLAYKLDYLSVPKHTGAAFRRMKAVNDGESPLLAGPVNLFFADDFIGNTMLEYIPVGDEVELLLGVEERITVERELIKREVDKVRLRDRRQLIFGYEIKVKNLMGAKANVELQDHIPVSRHEDINIKSMHFSPEPSEHSDLNLLEWRFSIAEGEERVIKYEFQVEHPRTMKVVGLTDR